MPSRFIWENPPEDAFAYLYDKRVQQIRQGVIIILHKRAVEIEAWMKENAIWEDHTGNARQTLWAEFVNMVDVLAIEFGHGMFYGDFLEYSHAGKYGILQPTIDHWMPIIIQDLREMLGR